MLNYCEFTALLQNLSDINHSLKMLMQNIASRSSLSALKLLQKMWRNYQNTSEGILVILLLFMQNSTTK